MNTEISTPANSPPGKLRRLLGSTPVKGLLVGLAAGKALDWVSIALYDNEKSSSRWKENRARKGRFPYEVAVQKIAQAAGGKLTRREERQYGWKFHQAFGLLSGIQYVALRKKFPGLGAGVGLLFGVGFFFGVDELLMPLLGLSPGPGKFSPKVHGRGAASHVAYGVAAEAAARVMDKIGGRAAATA